MSILQSYNDGTQTDLTNLKYGNDRPGGGSSNEPYLFNPLFGPDTRALSFLQDLKPFAPLGQVLELTGQRLRDYQGRFGFGFDRIAQRREQAGKPLAGRALRNFQPFKNFQGVSPGPTRPPGGILNLNTEGIIRGGMYAPFAAADDVKRIARKLFDTKNFQGALFIAKQNILSKSAVKPPQARGLKYAMGTLNEGIYSPASTLAQVAAGFLGQHYTKQGVRILGGLNRYEDFVKGRDRSSDIFNGFPTDSRIFGIHQNNNFIKPVTRGFFDRRKYVRKNPALKNYKQPNRDGFFARRIRARRSNRILYSYSGGPGAEFFAFGRTFVTRATDRKGQPSVIPSTQFNFYYNHPTEDYLFSIGAGAGRSSEGVGVEGRNEFMFFGTRFAGAQFFSNGFLNYKFAKNLEGYTIRPSLAAIKDKAARDLADGLPYYSINIDVNNSLYVYSSVGLYDNIKGAYNLLTDYEGVDIKIGRRGLLSNLFDVHLNPGDHRFFDGRRFINKQINKKGNIIKTMTNNNLGVRVQNFYINYSKQLTYLQLLNQFASLDKNKEFRGLTDDKNNVTSLAGIKNDFRRFILDYSNQGAKYNSTGIEVGSRTQQGDPGGPINTLTNTTLYPQLKDPDGNLILESPVENFTKGLKKLLNPGQQVLTSDKRFATDQINVRPWKEVRSSDTVESYLFKDEKDIIQFKIQVIDNNNPDLKRQLTFRAFLGNISDKFSSKWASHNYAGRSETFYTFQGNFERTISLSFMVAAQSKAELIPMYKNLNFLASCIAGDYTEHGYLAGNLMTLTIGGYVYEVTGFLDGINYTMKQGYPWEIGLKFQDNEFSLLDDNGKILDNQVAHVDNEVKQLCHYIEVTGFSFKVIHCFNPSIAKDSPDATSKRFISLANKGHNNYNPDIPQCGGQYAIVPEPEDPTSSEIAQGTIDEINSLQTYFPQDIEDLELTEDELATIDRINNMEEPITFDEVGQDSNITAADFRVLELIREKLDASGERVIDNVEVIDIAPPKTLQELLQNNETITTVNETIPGLPDNILEGLDKEAADLLLNYQGTFIFDPVNSNSNTLDIDTYNLLASIEQLDKQPRYFPNPLDYPEPIEGRINIVDPEAEEAAERKGRRGGFDDVYGGSDNVGSDPNTRIATGRSTFADLPGARTVRGRSVVNRRMKKRSQKIKEFFQRVRGYLGAVWNETLNLGGKRNEETEADLDEQISNNGESFTNPNPFI